jgi:tetratricopeptide (TPR) repeat protein
MARKKLNVKFIGILIAALVGVAVLVVGLIFGRDLLRPSIETLEARGDEYLAAGDYELAQETFSKAAFRARTNIPLQIKFVDAFDRTVQGDREKLMKLRQFYSTIFATDPNNVEIVRRMLGMQLSIVRSNPANRPELRSMIDTANRLLALVPDDREARKALAYSVIEPWEANLEASPEEVDKTRTLVEALHKQDSTDSESLMLLSRIYREDARRAWGRDPQVEGPAALEKFKTFADDAVKATPDSAAAQLVKFIAYSTLSGFPRYTNEERIEFGKAASEALLKADELAKPEQFAGNPEQFLQIRQAAIRSIEMADRPKAEERYRQLIEELPNHRWPRMLLAQYLQKMPGRLADAAKVLETPWTPKQTLRAMDSLRQDSLRTQEQFRLATIWLAWLGQEGTAADNREAKLVEVEKLYAELAALPGPSTTLQAWLNRIAGGIALERGKLSEAIANYDAALKLLPADVNAGGEAELRNETLMEYAAAHLRLGQTGTARPALMELVARDRLNMQARVQLTRLLQSERKFEEAGKQIDDLERFLGKENLIVEQLRIANYSGREDELRTRYATMPETTVPQMAIKLQTAGQLGDGPEQERLARAILAADPKQSQVAAVLAQMLLRSDKRVEALALLDAAITASPEDKQIKNLRESIAAETSEDRRALLEQRIEDITDPYQRELSRSEVLRLQNKADEAMAALKKAETINPKDLRAPQQQFELYLAQQKPTEAAAVLERLVALKADESDLETRRVRLIVARAQAETSPETRKTLIDEALVLASQVSRRYPEIAQPTLIYASLLQDTGSYDTALEQYLIVLDKQPTNVPANRGAVACLVALKRFEEARTRLASARNLAPTDDSLKQMEMSLELEYGDPMRVIDSLQAIQQRDQDNSQTWAQLGYALERVAMDRAQKQDQKGAIEFNGRAIALWQSAMAKFPTELRFAIAYADAQRRGGNPAQADAAIEALVANPAWSDKPEAIELLATQYQRSGKPEQAEAVLAQFIARTKPIPTSTLLKLAMHLIDRQRVQDALAVLDLQKDDPQVRRTRIELLIMANDLDSARRAVQEGLATDPTTDMRLLAAFVEFRSGKWDQADGFLATVLNERPNDPAALYYRAQVRLNQSPSDVPGAQADLQRVLSLNPGNSEARLTYAELLNRQNQRDIALQQLETAWRYSDRSKVVLLRLVDSYLSQLTPQPTSAMRAIDGAKQRVAEFANDPDILLAEANVQMALSQNKRAVEVAKQALAVAPDNAQLQQRYYEVLLRAGSLREMLKESEPVLAKDKGAWWLYRLRGIAQRRLEQRPEATQSFDAALNLVVAAQNEQAINTVARTIWQELGINEAIKRVAPLAENDNASKLLLATLYQAANDPAKAVAVLERVRTDIDRLRPEQKRLVLQALGSTYLQITPPAPDKARQVYETLLQDMPNDMLLLNNLAYVYTLPDSGGTVKKALEFSTRAYAISQTISQFDPSVKYVQDTHGWVMVLNGQLADGINLLRTASEGAGFPDVHMHLAEAYLMDGQLSEARRALGRAEETILTLKSKNQPIDPAIRPRLDRLSADLDAKEKAALGAAQ